MNFIIQSIYSCSVTKSKWNYLMLKYIFSALKNQNESLPFAPKEEFCERKFCLQLNRFFFFVWKLKKKVIKTFFLLWNGKIKCTTTFQCHGQASKLCSPSIKRYSMYLTYVCNLHNVHLSIHWISTMTNEYIE